MKFQKPIRGGRGLFNYTGYLLFKNNGVTFKLGDQHLALHVDATVPTEHLALFDSWFSVDGTKKPIAQLSLEVVHLVSP